MSLTQTVASAPFEAHDRNAYRLRRFARFLALVDEVIAEKGRCRILDIGGTQSYWLALRETWQGRDIDITLVNLTAEPVTHDRFKSFAGDARRIELPDNSFDVVHSNSVIEHVGRWRDMLAMAGEVRRLAPRYFVQTPNFWFPVEPHFRFPFFHWLPESVRLTIVRNRACGFFPKAATIDDGMRFVEDSSLIDMPRMRRLFPDAELEREHAYGFTKSLIAIRSPSNA